MLIDFFTGLNPILQALIATLFTWFMTALGSGLVFFFRTINRFVIAGPYQFTRNPQYLGDVILFVGITILSNSLYLATVHVLGESYF